MVVEESPHKKDAGQADSKEDRRGVLSGALCQRRRAPFWPFRRAVCALSVRDRTLPPR